MANHVVLDQDVETIARQVGIVMILSGLANVFFFSIVSYLGWAVLCSIPTFGLCFGCGFIGLLLIPFGFAEIFVGALVMADPGTWLKLARYLSMLEVVALLGGSPASFVAGLLVLALTGRDEVQPLLEG